jgi:hypothetical protein
MQDFGHHLYLLDCISSTEMLKFGGDKTILDIVGRLVPLPKTMDGGNPHAPDTIDFVPLQRTIEP